MLPPSPPPPSFAPVVELGPVPFFDRRPCGHTAVATAAAAATAFYIQTVVSISVAAAAAAAVASGHSIVNLKHNVEAIWAEEEGRERMGTRTLLGKITIPKWLSEGTRSCF